MTTIDSRIVHLGFDNGQFQGGVRESIKSLEDLKKGLKLDEAAKSLTGLSAAGKSFTLSGIANGVEAIAGKFNALGVVGFTIMQNLTNMAIQAGNKIIRSIIDPMKMGFSEYETQMNAIQTILANTSSKGTTIDQVNASLDELNEYSDKTIYNFTEMTKNIGTFTAAGVDLDTSVRAIKGISNLAAMSGSNSQQAATGMYQLSQAISTGTVRLMDWNSVVNAGMGGEVFQNALKETARVHGVAVDDMIKREGSFRESLQTGWLSSEILLETLSKFTGDLTEQQLEAMGYTQEQIASIITLGKTANDAATKVKTITQLFDTLKEATQSGWAQTWRIVVGDFEEARELFTWLSDSLGGLIGASAESRNNLLQGWKDLGGRTEVVGALKNVMTGLVDVLNLVSSAFREIFPPLTAKQLMGLTHIITSISEKFKLSSVSAANLKNTFKGLFALLDIGRMLFSSLGKEVGRMLTNILPSGNSILDLTGSLGESIVRLRDWIKENDAFTKAIAKFKEYVQLACAAIENLLAKIIEFYQKLKSSLSPTAEWFLNFGKKVIDSFVKGFEMFNKIDTSGATKLFDGLKLQLEPLTSLGKLVGAVIGGIGKALLKLEPLFFNLSTIAGQVFGRLSTAIMDGFQNFNFERFFDFVNGGLLAALLLAIKNFFNSGSGVFGGISDLLGGITGILDGVRGSLEAWQTNLKAEALLKLAGALAILAVSVIGLSMVDSEKLTNALIAMAAMFAQLTVSMNLMNNVKIGNNMTGVVIALLAMSTAVLLLSGAVMMLGSLDAKQLIKGTLAVQGLTLTLIIFAEAMSKNSGKMLKGAGGLILFAVAIRILVGAVKELGEMDLESLKQGLVGVFVLCTELAIFLKATDLNKMGIGKAVGLLVLAGAINVLAIAVSKFGALNPSALIQGLSAIAVVLAEMALFIKMTSESKKVMSTAIGITILGAAMLIFAEAVSRMGALSWEQIGKGMTAMAGSLALVTASLRLMPKNMVATSLGLLAVATSMLILSSALKNMGGMSWEEIGKGLVTLAASMLILVLGLHGMKTALPGAAALVVVAGALSMIVPVLKTLGSMAIGEIAVGLLAIAGLFAVLGAAGSLLTPVIPTLMGLSISLLLFGAACAAVGLGISLFATGLAALAVSGTGAAVAIVAIITSILGIIPLIVQKIGEMVVAFAQVLIVGAPAILEAFTVILLSLITAIAIVTPPLILAFTALILNLLTAARTLVPAFVETALFLLMSLATGLAAALPTLIQAGFDILIGILTGIRNNIQQIVTVAGEVIAEFLLGISNTIPDIIKAAFEVLLSFIDGLTAAVDEYLPRINEAVNKLVDAIIDGLVAGITGGISDVGSALASLGLAALDALKRVLGIRSPSREMGIVGDFAVEGFVAGLVRHATAVKKAATEISDSAVSGMSDVVSRISDALDGDLDMNPTIRPVVDLTDIVSGGKQIDRLIGGKQINLAASRSRLPSFSNGGRMQTDADGVPIPQSPNQNISFTQYNYSPVALSNADIYRQTRSQLSRMKGLLTT